MKSRQLLAVAVLAVASTGCFQQVVRSGLPAGQTIVDQPWVSTWIFGLVEADPIDVRVQCPRGVAVVRTQQSFANGLVGILTLGIYTPQHVTVTCASGTARLPDARLEIRVAEWASDADRAGALRQAIAESLAHGETIIVRF